MPFSLKSLFDRKQDPGVVVVVSGLPRSGTSMMMKMLEAGGLPVMTDHLREADDNNPRGYYEFERVKKLKEGDTDWVHQAPGKVVKVISALLEHLPDDYSYKVVFMQRHMDEILASQRRMLERDGKPGDQVSDEKLAALYEKHLRKVELWLADTPSMDVLYVSYNDVLADPDPQIARVAAFLGGGLDTAAMRRVVDKNLYRERQG